MIYDFKELKQLDNLPYLKDIEIDIKKVLSEDYQVILVNKYFLNNNSYFIDFFKNILKIFLQVLCQIKIESKINKLLKKKYVFFFDDIHRKDKINLFNSIVNSFKNIKSFSKIESFKKLTYYRFDKIKNIIKKTHLLFIFLFKYKSQKKINFIEKLYLASKLLKCFNDYKNIKRLDLNQKNKFFFFNQYNYYQNMICQVANNKNITTFSCDHAIYDFKKVKYPMMLDSMIYSMSAKYFLCWGKYNKINFEERINNSKIKFLESCHPLRMRYRLDSKILKYNNFSNIIVLLAKKKYFKQNYALINIIKKYSIKYNFRYTIKLHPGDKKSRYKNIDLNDKFLNEVLVQEKNIEDLYDAKSICVFYKTSGYFELISRGIPSYKYIKEKNKLYGVYSFNNLKMLEELINKKINRKHWYTNEVKPWINHMYGKVTNNPSSIYKKIICEKI